MKKNDPFEITMPGISDFLPKKKIGLVAGAFDVIHPGYIRLFKEAKEHCDHLIVAVHVDPSVERPEKMTPILSARERAETLMAIRYVDEVVDYTNELVLSNTIQIFHVDILFVGDDWQGKEVTGAYMVKEVYYHDRDHNWSATEFKRMIAQSYYDHIERGPGDKA